ncbi:WxL domain-containing protein, partial [Enterococcus faecium]|uniref:WxL domain-containing protein n=1 Tax=Enterococcus faecium TaxID=1352 RepID=UPI000B570130
VSSAASEVNKRKVYAALQSGTESTGAQTQVQNFVQVTDKSGNYAGWKLSVKRTEFIGTTSDTKFVSDVV